MGGRLPQSISSYIRQGESSKIMRSGGSELGAAAGNVFGKLIKIFFGLVMVGIIVVIGLSIYFFFELGQRPSTKDDQYLFSISKGDTFSAITDALYKEKLIRNTFVFRVRAKLWDVESKVQSGTVTLRRNMTVDEVLEAISSVRLNDRNVTILEGWRLEQIAQQLADNGWDKNKFIKAVREESWDFGFLNDKPAGASVEGFLFPDTYKIPANFTESQIVEMMLRRFGDQFDKNLRDKSRDLNGIYKTVILASLIEREAAKADERPKISSVFYNRLKLNMKLQTDPTAQWARDTVVYTQEKALAKWWTEPSKEDINIESPYNTYKINGLPPGPICNPGLASLRAAVEPYSTDFLFFVATGDRDGSHAFAKTLEEHNQNIKKYQVK